MAQRTHIHDDEIEPEQAVFLKRHGIEPINGSFSEHQLVRALIRRGWRSELSPEHVAIMKAFPPSGVVAQSFSYHGPDRVAGLASVLAKAIRFDEEHGLSEIGPMQIDIVARAPDQQVLALVEAKGGSVFSDEIAASLRDTFTSASAHYSRAPYFMIVTPNHAYLWDQRSGLPAGAPATLKFSMAPVIAHYLPWLTDGERPGATEIQLATARWLKDLATSAAGEAVTGEELLAETAFVDAIQGATIVTDATL